MPGRALHRTGRKPNRQDRERNQQQDEMDDCLEAKGKAGRQKMRVSIAGQQHGLKKYHAGVPDRRGAAQQRQKHLGNHRLHPKQEHGAGEQGGNKKPDHIIAPFKPMNRPSRVQSSR